MSITLVFVMLAFHSIALAASSENVIDDFSEGLARMKKNNLYGFVDVYGNWIIEPVYDNVGSFVEGYAAVITVDGKKGLIDKAGNFVANTGKTFLYEGVSEGLYSSSFEFASARYYSKYFSITQDAVIPKPPAGMDYRTVHDFSEGLALVEIGSRHNYGWNDDCYYAFIDHAGEIQVRLDDEWMKVADNRMLCSYPDYSGFIDGYAVLSGEVYNLAGTQIYDDCSIIVDKEGNKTCVLRYDRGYGFYGDKVINCGNGVFCVFDHYASKYDQESKRYLYNITNYYYMDANGNNLTGEYYSALSHWSPEELAHISEEGLMLVGIDKKGKIVPCYIDITGKVVIANQGWEDASYFSEGLAAVCKDGKWGYINTSGEYVIEPQYDAARDFSCGVAIVDIGDDWFIIDVQGNVLY